MTIGILESLLLLVCWALITAAWAVLIVGRLRARRYLVPMSPYRDALWALARR